MNVYINKFMVILQLNACFKVLGFFLFVSQGKPTFRPVSSNLTNGFAGLLPARHSTHTKLSYEIILKIPCVGRRWQACCLQDSPCWDADDSQQDTRPLQTWRWGSWPGGSGPASGSSRQHVATAPLLLEPAPVAVTRQSYIKLSMKHSSFGKLGVEAHSQVVRALHQVQVGMSQLLLYH